MNYKAVIITQQSTWSKIAHSHWIHTWEYKSFQENLGRSADCVHLYDEDHTLVGYFTIITYQIYKLKNICYTPYGPVFLGNPTRELLQLYRQFITQYGQDKNAICVRCELGCKIPGFFKTPIFAYRTSFHQPRGEAILDLTGLTDTGVLANVSKSTKRNIKKAEKNDLSFRISKGAEISKEVHTFIDINNTNISEHNTTTHNREYFVTLFDQLSAGKDNFVVVITKDGEALAINVFTVFGTSAYCPFGASTSFGKKMQSYYWIKWHALQYMLKNNISEFNWGGIAIGKNDDNLSGLNSFKLGWGTKEKHHNDFYDAVLSPLYWLYLGYSFLKQLRN